MLALEVGDQRLLEATDLGDFDVLQEATLGGIQDSDISAIDIGAYCFCFISSVTR